MTQIITIANQKGGVAKTTTAEALTSGLTLLGNRVLAIDADQQGNFSYNMRSNPDVADLADVLSSKANVEKAIQSLERADIISSGNLNTFDTNKNITPDILNNVLEKIKNNYDFIIIDTPPSLGIITINALTASDFVIIPAQADIYSLQGIGQLYQTISAVKMSCNPNLHILGILITRYNNHAIMNREARRQIEETATAIDTKVFRSTIREGVVIREAQAAQESIFNYANKSNPAVDYLDFVAEVLVDCEQFAASHSEE